jgi:hypothetical protein
MKTVYEENSLIFIQYDEDIEINIENDHQPESLLLKSIARNHFIKISKNEFNKIYKLIK